MKKVLKNNVSWVGYMDWEIKKFHGDDFTINHGSSQNAYLLEYDKTVLIDTVWAPHRFEFVENLKKEIDLNKIDFIVMNHGECDHSGALPALMAEIPHTPIYCTAAAVKSLEGQYGKNGWDFHVVKTGDSIEIGPGRTLTFVEMKMLHWPDSMATFLSGDNILFSNDAFGQHYAVAELYNDLANQCVLYQTAIKYFVNIVHPYAGFLSKKLTEIAALNLPIEMIAPSHGVIWRDNPTQIVEKYAKWADAYQEDQITILYDTMWEGTAKIAHALSEAIKAAAPNTVVKVMHIAKSDKNDIMTEIFKSKAILVGSPTVCNDMLSSVAGMLAFAKSLRFKNKKAAAFGCYGWSGEAVKNVQSALKDAGFNVIEETVKSFWNPTAETLAQVPALVEALLKE